MKISQTGHDKIINMYHTPPKVYFYPAIQPECFDTEGDACSFAFDHGRRIGVMGHPFIKDVVCQGTHVNGLPSFIVFRQYYPDQDATKYYCMLM